MSNSRTNARGTLNVVHRDVCMFRKCDGRQTVSHISFEPLRTLARWTASKVLWYPRVVTTEGTLCEHV